MTSISLAIRSWTTHPVGKALRVAIGGLGTISAVLVLMTAVVVSSGSWALVILGIALAASSVRTALAPTTARLLTLAMIVMAIPLTIQAF